MKLLTALAAAGLLAVALPATQAQQEQFGHCGNITLVFMNPDIRPREDGYVHVSGTFFIQFQAIGETAAQVATIAFSFGKPIPDPVTTCDAPGEPVTGVRIPKYRVDKDGSDGFFVPINTTLVPDGEYSAAITAFDSGGGYLAQFYTKAIVENGAECRTQRVCQDNVMPWPMILPGDGEQTNGVNGITIEFGEFVADVTVKINGEQVIPQPWTPPERDDDAKPDNDDEDCGPLNEGPPRGAPVCRRVLWGSGFIVDRVPNPGDVIEVQSIDQAGIPGTKIVTVGGVTQGGTIVLVEPELTLSAETTEAEVEAGQTAEYRLKLVNVGEGTAEARMTVEGPEGVVTEWDSPTVQVEKGAERFVTFKATPAQDLRPGGYTLLAKATYKSGTADQEKQLVLTLRVTEYRPVPQSPIRQTRANVTEAPEDDAGANRAPGLEPALLVAAGAAVAIALRGRQRRP